MTARVHRQQDAQRMPLKLNKPSKARPHDMAAPANSNESGRSIFFSHAALSVNAGRLNRESSCYKKASEKQAKQIP